jgi:hypothetical protein
MEILVTDRWDDGVSTSGKMLTDGTFECYTLEPSQTAEFPSIPEGRYKVELVKSERFKEVVPRLIDVPGRSYIEIHPGNDAANTEGCTLVGETRSRDWIGSSRYAFTKLMYLLQAVDTDNIYVTYTKAVQV